MYPCWFCVLCTLLPSTVCPLPPSTSHCTVGWFCITRSTAASYSLSTVSQFLTLYRLLILWHCVHCRLLESVHCLSVPHTVPSVDSVSLCSLLSSTFCQLSVSTSHCTVCWFCISMSTAAFYSLSTVSQFLTLYRLLILCHCVHFCLLHSANCLSVPHTHLVIVARVRFHATVTPSAGSPTSLTNKLNFCDCSGH